MDPPKPPSPPPPSRDAGALEAMPHLKQKICLMWGSPELDIFISRLIMDSRDGKRQGLPMQVGAELLFLAQTNKLIRAIDLLSQQKMTLKEAYQMVDAGDQKRLEADLLDNPLISRDTVVEDKPPPRPAVAPARPAARPPPPPAGAVEATGQLLFRVLFNKITLVLIGAALTAKLLWPIFFKASE